MSASRVTSQGDGEAPDLIRDGAQRFFLHVRHGDGLGALLREALRQRTADSAGPAGDDRNPALDLQRMSSPLLTPCRCGLA